MPAVQLPRSEVVIISVDKLENDAGSIPAPDSPGNNVRREMQIRIGVK